ncbi:DUF6247 family protein [Streptomyces sp. NPDC090054]|uniref:DUF6247 family protein n=1 Tax=Streptomyces sp. NPDC090054 TaxID=3365933 RepID=UPI003810CA1D
MSFAAEPAWAGGVPQPAATVEELRAALTRIAPDAVATFDAERAAAVARARQEVSSAPMRRFLRQWALHVALERHPDLSPGLRRIRSSRTAGSTPSPCPGSVSSRSSA